MQVDDPLKKTFSKRSPLTQITSTVWGIKFALSLVDLGQSCDANSIPGNVSEFPGGGKRPSHWENLFQRVTRALAQFIWKPNTEVQDHVPSLGRTLGQWKPFSDNSLLHSRFDDVFGGYGDGPSIQSRGFDRAAT